ncbi:MAG: ribonuclease III [Lachnospiraceae bacterium]|nr:ribonuclease III [Candidatus Minthocola equi]
MDFTEAEKAIGYEFHDKELLRRAFTHSSYINEHHLPYNECNERLEFLGDAVLETSSSEFLFSKYPDKTEGELTRIRASLVCESSLADISQKLGLGDFILLGKGEEQSGGRYREAALEDVLEAVIGAVYLDGGFTIAKDFVIKHVMCDIENRHLFYDSKTILQEIVQASDMGQLSYELIKAEGPDHARIFTSHVLIGDVVFGEGEGKSKKLSEQQAAYKAILKINNQE